MASLYSIQEDILRLFDDIEEAGGEITDEQCEQLAIKEEELKDKLTNYHKALQSWTSDIANCKDEEKRIKAVRQKYENRISRLKENMLTAVQMFGSEGKTNRYIELPTVRLSTRSSKAVEVNTERINILIFAFSQLINDLVKDGILYTGEDIDLQGIVDVINANVIAEHGDDFKPFTIDDLTNLNLNISFNMSIYDYMIKGETVLDAMVNIPSKCTVGDNTLKETWKDAIENNRNITLAKIVNNQSLQIK